MDWFHDGSNYIAVETGRPQDAVRIGIGSTHEKALDSMETTAIQSVGRDAGLRAALQWAESAGWIDAPDDLVIVEVMPDHLRDSHREAGNWGDYPYNGAEREMMPREEAEELVDEDEDGYNEIVRDADPLDWLESVGGPDDDEDEDEGDDDDEDDEDDDDDDDDEEGDE